MPERVCACQITRGWTAQDIGARAPIEAAFQGGREKIRGAQIRATYANAHAAPCVRLQSPHKTGRMNRPQPVFVQEFHEPANAAFFILSKVIVNMPA